MTDYKSGKKETGQSQPFHDNSTPDPSCQEKTLVVQDTIRAKSVLKIYSHGIEFIPWHTNKSIFIGKLGSRGRIHEFSKRSRFRLFKIMAKIEDNLDSKPIFVSLTYHYGHLNDPRSTKTQLHLFLTRLRQFDPEVQFIWRTEFQIRGAPHYHLIIFPGSSCHYQNKTSYSITISKIWHSIADPKSKKHKEYGCHVKTINSYKEACIYLSKYVAKCADTEVNLIEGKHWGSSKNLPYKCTKTIELTDPQAIVMIEKIRLWLLKNGKYDLADSEFLNIYNEQFFFMDKSELLSILESELPYDHKLPVYVGY
jgi:hypothetical protein